jgi:hypothetical protein
VQAVGEILQLSSLPEAAISSNNACKASGISPRVWESFSAAWSAESASLELWPAIGASFRRAP